MPTPDTRKPTESVTSHASIRHSANGDSDGTDIGSSPWWRLALAAAVAVVAIAATASLLA